MTFSAYFQRLNWWIIGVFFLKLLLLLVFFPYLLSRLGENYQAAIFPDGYAQIAENWLQGHGYRLFADTSLTMLRSPGFVIVLAAMFWLFGASLMAVQVLQLFMSFATATLIFYLAKRLFNSQLVAGLAALFFLFHPAVLIAESRGGVESTLMLCFTACVAFAYRLLDQPKWQNFVYFGILFGWTLLVKSVVAFFFPAFVLLACLWRPENLSVVVLLRRFLVAGLIALLIQVPWIVRNYEISGAFVPTMTLSGMALFQGVYVVQHPESHKDNWLVLQDAMEQQLQVARDMQLRMHENMFPQFYTPREEVDFYNQLGRLAMDEYKRSPVLVGQSILHNGWAFWFQGRTQKATLLNVIVTAPMLLLMLWGAKLAAAKTRAVWLLLLAMVTFIAPHLLILGVARYHIILMPFISILVALSLAEAWLWLQALRSNKQAVV